MIRGSLILENWGPGGADAWTPCSSKVNLVSWKTPQCGVSSLSRRINSRCWIREFSNSPHYPIQPTAVPRCAYVEMWTFLFLFDNVPSKKFSVLNSWVQQLPCLSHPANTMWWSDALCWDVISCSHLIRYPAKVSLCWSREFSNYPHFLANTMWCSVALFVDMRSLVFIWYGIH